MSDPIILLKTDLSIPAGFVLKKIAKIPWYDPPQNQNMVIFIGTLRFHIFGFMASQTCLKGKSTETRDVWA